MKCPICRIDSLTQVNLNTGLIANQCTQCFGHWISSDKYWDWLEAREAAANSAKSDAEKAAVNKPKHVVNLSVADSLLPVVDNNTANFCAECNRLMTKTKVGRGLNFYLDRCSRCHGVWLDQNELENLIEMDLHHQIHYMFSSAWQFSVRQEKPLVRKAPA